MKKINFLIAQLLSSLILSSCASNNVAAESEAAINDKNEVEEKLRFDDWKYKGFGNEIPAWVEFAVDMQITALKDFIPELNDAQTVKVISGYGENHDQAVEVAKQNVNEMLLESDEFKLYDSFWVRKNFELETEQTDMPYISVYVYYK